MGKVKDTSRTSIRWVEGKVMGKVKDTSRTSRRIGGRESNGKR